MLTVTTPHIQGKKIEHLGIVTGEVILGANFIKDFFASIRDTMGGRCRSYENVLRKAKVTALQEMEEEAEILGANAVIGVDLDYETIPINGGGSMLMVTATGTAVIWS